MDVGLVTAFLGGTLALLSPCGALLLPAFFASTVGARTRLLGHGAVFYAGLLVILVPLGVGAGALGALFVSQRETIVVAASVLLIVLGLAQVFGMGFDPSRLMPGADAVRSNAARSTGLVKSFLLGMVGGIAGFCAGPILGAVLTLAAAQGDAVASGTLLAIYGAGMVVPLMVLVASWQRLGARGQRALRGRGFTIKGRDFHTTSVATGVLIVLVGVVFWTTNGLLGAPEIVPSDAVWWLNTRASLLSNPIVDIAAVLVIAALVLVAWHRARARHRRHEAASETANAPDHQQAS